MKLNMKQYMIVYKPLDPEQHATRLVPVWGGSLEHAIRLADNVMRVQRKLNVAEFSTKYMGNMHG